MVRGEKGTKNGTPKDSVPKINVICTQSALNIPIIPKSAPANIYTNLDILNENESEYEGIANDAIPQTDTKIMIIGLTSPALTAACPKIKPPTMPRDEPIEPGILTEASLINSNDSSIIIISPSVEKVLHHVLKQD